MKRQGKAENAEYYDRENRAWFRKRKSSRRSGWDKHDARAERASRYVVGSVLDLGCGFGFLAKYVKGAYLGIDFSPFAVAKAKELNPGKEFMVADVCDLPSVGEFDTVTMLEVLEHLDEPAQVVESIKPIARKRIVISVPRGKNRAGVHTWNYLSKTDVEGLLGPGTTCWQWRRTWIAMWKREEL